MCDFYCFGDELYFSLWSWMTSSRSQHNIPWDFSSSSSDLILTAVPSLCSPQRCVYVDQPAGGGVGAVRLRAGCAGPGAADHQRGAGGAPPHRGCGCYRWPRCHTDQLQGRKATHAPPRLFPCRPAGSHLCCLQHVSARGGVVGFFSRHPQSSAPSSRHLTTGLAEVWSESMSHMYWHLSPVWHQHILATCMSVIGSVMLGVVHCVSFIDRILKMWQRQHKQRIAKKMKRSLLLFFSLSFFFFGKEGRGGWNNSTTL